MHSQPLPDCWNLDQILDDLNAHGFAIVNQAYSPEYHTQVAKECSHHFDEFREAGIQNGVVSTIRSDHILWINESLPVAEQHVETLTSFCQHLNQAFFLGIKEVEAHFACYNPGEFYALHRDNPQQKMIVLCLPFIIYTLNGKMTGVANYAYKIKTIFGTLLHQSLIA